MPSKLLFTAEQFERAQRMTPQQRFAEMNRLTAEAITAERQAIATANPHLDEQEVNLLWMEHAYGKDLADRVRQDLERRKHSQDTLGDSHAD
jgi:hypothetical protein